MKVLLLVLVLAGCGRVTWPETVACAERALDATRVVRVALGQEDWRDALEAVARERGPEVVLCVLRELAGQVGAAGVEDDRAALFLSEQGTEFR